MNELNREELSSKAERNPFFSIIMPVFNAAPFLRECLECIVRQSFTDWEAILVDDCSTDDSAEIAEQMSMEYPNIKIIKSSRNSGGAYQPRMRAAALASGKYLVTIDADDLISDDYLSRIHKSIVSQDVDLAVTEMWKLVGHKSEKKLPLDSIDTRRIWTGRDLVWHTLVLWGISMNGFAIRQDIYLKADRHITADDRRSIFADELLSRWILYMCEKVAICDARYYYRYNSESVTHINQPRIIEGRMHNAERLIEMAESTFGKDSPTYLKALENKLYSAVDMLRLINESNLERERKTTCEGTIRSAMKDFDLSLLTGKTSPRYLALMKLPLPLARIVLKIIDTIMRK